MNREIKFRAWDRKLFIMLDQSQMTCDKNQMEFGRRATLSGFLNNPDYMIMQYTGLHDKNGKEIYEGDIIDYGNGRNRPVEFINGCFCICKLTAMPTLMCHFEVIGNIYQNPSLL